MFNTDAEFHEVYDGPDYEEPWVSLTEDVDRVDYNKRIERTITVTYSNRAGTGSTFTEDCTGYEGEPVGFNVAAAPEQWDAEHQFIGWSTVEWPTYEQTQQPGFLKQGGDRFQSSEDITLYAVYSTTFQGLINEGYVRFSTADPTGDLGIKVLANNYPKELVVDFMNVFNNDPDKYIQMESSTYGVVGASTGRPYNTFMFTSTGMAQYWLTSDEWYDIYNNATLPHWPQSFQFYGMDWSNKDSVTLNFGGTPASTWCAARCAFGPYMPKTLNVNMVNGNGWAYMSQTYGHVGNGCGSEIINLTAIDGRKATAIRRPTTAGQGFNAIFEGARSLKEVHGLETAGVTVWSWAFDGCRSLEIIPSADFNTEIRIVDSAVQLFCNNWELVTIEPVLNVSATTQTALAFYLCQKLETVYLKGINAANNYCDSRGLSYPQDSAYTWDMHDTKMSQASADYMITNLTPFDPTSVQDYVPKGINFPTTVTLSDSQITTLTQNGWKPYINGEEIFASA